MAGSGDGKLVCKGPTRENLSSDVALCCVSRGRRGRKPGVRAEGLFTTEDTEGAAILVDSMPVRTAVRPYREFAHAGVVCVLY